MGLLNILFSTGFWRDLLRDSGNFADHYLGSLCAAFRNWRRIEGRAGRFEFFSVFVAYVFAGVVATLLQVSFQEAVIGTGPSGNPSVVPSAMVAPITSSVGASILSPMTEPVVPLKMVQMPKPVDRPAMTKIGTPIEFVVVHYLLLQTILDYAMALAMLCLMFVVSTAQVRRLHDIGYSGYCMLPYYGCVGIGMLLVACVDKASHGHIFYTGKAIEMNGVIIGLYLLFTCFETGEDKENRYGKPPEISEKEKIWLSR